MAATPYIHLILSEPDSPTGTEHHSSVTSKNVTKHKVPKLKGKAKRPQSAASCLLPPRSYASKTQHNARQRTHEPDGPAPKPPRQEEKQKASITPPKKCHWTRRRTRSRCCASTAGAGTSCDASRRRCRPRPPPTAPPTWRWATPRSSAPSTGRPRGPRRAAAGRETLRSGWRLASPASAVSIGRGGPIGRGGRVEISTDAPQSPSPYICRTA